MNTPDLSTRRLTLRKFTEHDIDALYEIYSDREVNRFLPWFPLTSIEEARTLYLERYAAEYRKPSGYAYAICLKSDNIPIGYLHLSADEPHDLGYGLSKAFWHQGIVSEAALALITQAKQDGLPYITATHDRENPRSGGVMKNLGMTYQYSYEELWQPKQISVVFRLYQLNLDGSDRPAYSGYRDASAVHFTEADL